MPINKVTADCRENHLQPYGRDLRNPFHRRSEGMRLLSLAIHASTNLSETSNRIARNLPIHAVGLWKQAWRRSKPTNNGIFRFAKGGNLVWGSGPVNVPEVIIRVFFHKVNRIGVSL
jgi:hypothetical protein